ncbi:hypothetical protein [Peterkaempfera sp. SMS 1(5)a]|uniref:hypothetical protein n=1 Tax=Peterkaempfera podocarpi TaxID=3232308 RepID=UPI00366F9BAF
MKNMLRRLAEATYVALIAGLATAGAISEKPVFYLLAVVLTLPFGAAALLAIYGAYAALSGIGRIWAPVTRPDGSEAGWLGTGSATVNVILLAAAALADVVLLERVLRSRRLARSHR